MRRNTSIRSVSHVPLFTLSPPSPSFPCTTQTKDPALDTPLASQLLQQYSQAQTSEDKEAIKATLVRDKTHCIVSMFYH